MGTWELGMRDEGLEDIKNGTQGRVGRGCGEKKYIRKRDVNNYCKS